MIKFPYDEKRALLPEIRHFFEEEHGEAIGDLAAERMLDFFLRRVGPRIYNQAITEARLFLHRRFEDLECEFYGLETMPPEEERDAARMPRTPECEDEAEPPRPRYLLPDDPGTAPPKTPPRRR